MGQNDNPFFNNTPSEPPRNEPDQRAEPDQGARIYGETPSAFSAPAESPTPVPPAYTPATPSAPPYATATPGAPIVQPAAPASNSRRIWLTRLIVLLMLCCCCVLIGALGWVYGDQVLCNIDPSFGTCTFR